jgi:guanylate cyclase
VDAPYEPQREETLQIDLSSLDDAPRPPGRVRRLGQLVAGVAALDSDSEDERFEKALLTSLAVLMSAGGVLWGLLMLAVGQSTLALVPFGYTLASALNVLAYRALGRYDLFRATQLFLTLGLPLALQIGLGGFGPGGGTVAWSLLAPLGALMFCTERQARVWFGLFLLALTVAIVADGAFEAVVMPSPVGQIYAALNVVVPTAAAFAILRYFVLEKERTLHALDQERDLSERLLLNVLPAEIAATLKAGEEAKPEHFDAVTVLFADIVGFTRLSERLPPDRMVELLNRIFSAFDQIAERYGVEKIRTIGDNYMVAAGAPQRRADHAVVLVRMGLEMIAYLDGLDAKDPVRDFTFRVGINSGPAVGGVVGNQKFHYDLWGDAVNVASRMESHGVPGRVHIGVATHALIEDEFECEPRGEIEIKGKGRMNTWLVVGPRPPAHRR